MSRKSRFLIVILLAFLIIMTIVSYRFMNFATQKAVLEGRVLKIGLVKVGDRVASGDILLKINGLVGPVPAARANIDGEVVNVYVKSGDMVESGQKVVLIKKKK